MTQDQLRLLLEDVRSGATGVDAALARMRHLPFEDLGFAKVDHHRALRHGMPEVVFAKGKTAVVPNTQLRATEKAGQLREVRAGASLRDVVKALNALDVSPRDLVAILQSLKAAGALHAELEIQ